MQGGIHPDLPGTAYFDLARRSRTASPDMHVHAFSPMEVVNGASRSGLSIRDWLIEAKDAGLDSIPGTAAEILDDEVRWVLTKGKLPTASWIEVVTTAHELGLRSVLDDDVRPRRPPRHWLAHLRLLAGMQDATGGFTEFVPLPVRPPQRAGLPRRLARPGPDRPREPGRARDGPAAAARRASTTSRPRWVKLGTEGCRAMLRGGANDLGGTLMEETISRMAGSEHGSRLSIAELEAMARPPAGPPGSAPPSTGRSARSVWAAAPAGRVAHALLVDAQKYQHCLTPSDRRACNSTRVVRRGPTGPTARFSASSREGGRCP